MPNRSILFICAALEPGRDGVGDYTRALAGECRTQGHATRMVALNDPHIPAGKPTIVDAGHTLRLPTGMRWAEKERHVREFLTDFKPDITSWQMVGYGYSPKGILPSELIRMAPRISHGTRHVMMHEVWIGFGPVAPLRQRLMGWLQRRRLLRFLQALAPELVHTSNIFYQKLLGHHFGDAMLLPLFGNIPITEPNPSSLPGEVLAALAIPNRMKILLFGTVHREWEPPAFAHWALHLAERRGLRPLVIAAGRMGAHAPSAFARLSQTGIEVVLTGPISEEAVLTLMRQVDYGVGLHPWALIQKSGVVAAMLDHGLPVIVPREDLPGAEGDPDDPLLLRMSSANDTWADQWVSSRRPPRPSLPCVAAQFLADIHAWEERA